jgi:hypothetical protein
MRLRFTFVYLFVLVTSLLATYAGKGQTIPSGAYLPIIAKPGSLPVATITPTNTPPEDPSPTATLLPAGQVSILNSNTFSPFEDLGWTNLVGEVVNNTGGDVGSVKIDAILRDNAGAIVDGESTYTSIGTLAPGMTSPFKIIFFNSPAWATYELTLTWDNDPFSSPYVLEVLELESYFDGNDAFHARGKVRNPDTVAHEFVTVHVTLYNSAGQVIGTDYTFTNPTTLNPSQEVPVDVEVYSWKGKPDRSQVASYSVKAVDD